MKVRLHFVLVSTIVFLISIAGCRKNIGEQFGTNSSEFTAEEQATLGKAILSNMQSRKDQFPFLSADEYPEAYNYMQDSLLGPLVYGSTLHYRNDFDWQIHIIGDDNIDNAFALPGGQLVVYSGLLKYLDGNDEATSVLAHEIAYTDNEKIIEKLTRRFDRFELNAMASGQFSSSVEGVADYFKSLVYLQKDVLFADSIAMDMICPFNYKASALLELLNRTEANQERIDWIEKRDAEKTIRKQELVKQLSENSECSEGEQLELQSAYERFKSTYLP